MIQCNFLIGIICSAMIMSTSAPISPEKEMIPKEKTVAIMAEKQAEAAEYAKENAEETTEPPTEPPTEEETVPETQPPTEPETQPPTEEAVGVFSEGFDSSFKAYMDYRCITDTSSVQYDLQQQAYTDERGFRRIGDDYCVALGTGFTNGCGERFLITLDSGYSFTAIVSDVKANCHTDSTNCYVPRGGNSGNVVEFIIDKSSAESAMLNSGNAGYYADLSGNVLSIQKI